MIWHPRTLIFLNLTLKTTKMINIELPELAIKYQEFFYVIQYKVQVIAGTSVLKLSPMSNQVSEGAMTVAI